MDKPDKDDDGPAPAGSETRVPVKKPEPSPPALAGDPRRPEVEEELRRWHVLDRQAQDELLRHVVAKRSGMSPEALVHITRHAFGRDERRFNLAFCALATVATPLLLYQASDLTGTARLDQAQTVLMQLFCDIKLGKVDFAERFFAGYTKKKAISLFRARKARIEGKRQQVELVEPEEEPNSHPLEMSQPEVRALLRQALGKLSPKHREAFIQRHVLEMTQREIAIHHGVDVRTIYNRQKEAKAHMGLAGGEDDRES